MSDERRPEPFEDDAPAVNGDELPQPETHDAKVEPALEEPLTEGDPSPPTEPGEIAAEDDGGEGESDEVQARLRQLSRRGFLTMAAAAGAGYAGWKWLETRPLIDRRPWPYRRALQVNERLAMAYYDGDRLSPTFPPGRIEPLRPNGRIGLQQNQNVDDWSVSLYGVAGTSGPVDVPLSEIKALPGYEMITELRCIEGWSRINRWTGTQLIELMKRYPPETRDGSPPDIFRRPERLVRYVSIETPGRGYFVGLDMASAIHPQTLLVWAMNDKPIDWLHGAPLRLGIPLKYGIKNIKRIATIRYTDSRPADYWAERGYDWYAGF